MISVITPCYQHRQYLPQAIGGILKQTIDDFELILVNDEPTSDLCLYEKIDNRIVVLQDGCNKGQPARLNEGVAYARGDYIAFQDADDWSLPYRLELSLAMIDEYDALISDAISVQADSMTYIKSPHPLVGVIRQRSFGVFSSTFIRAEIAKEVFFRHNVGYGNDRCWWIDLFRTFPELRVRRINIPLYYYRNYSSTFRPFQRFPVIRKLHRKYIKYRLQHYVDRLY